MALSKKRFKQVVRVAVSLLLLATVYHRVDFQELRALLISARVELLLVSLILLYVNTALSALKWGFFLHADGIRIPFLKLLNSYLIGGFMNLFLPSNIGGDAYRVIDISRRSGCTAGTFASVLADRISGLAALVVLGLAFGLVGFRFLPDGLILVVLAVMILLGAMIAMLFQEQLLRSIFSKTPLGRIPELAAFAERLLSSTIVYRRARGLFCRVMAISFIFQLNVIASIFVLSRALGFDIPFLYFCIFIPLISVIEAIPISIYGLGIRDASYVLFFTQVGVARVDALAMALAYVILTLIYSLIGGVIFLWRSLQPPTLEFPKDAKDRKLDTPILGEVVNRKAGCPAGR